MKNKRKKHSKIDLLSLPETGMGYQVGDVDMGDGNIDKNILFVNGIVPSKYRNAKSVKVKTSQLIIEQGLMQLLTKIGGMKEFLHKMNVGKMKFMRQLQYNPSVLRQKALDTVLKQTKSVDHGKITNEAINIIRGR